MPATPPPAPPRPPPLLRRRAPPPCASASRNNRPGRRDRRHAPERPKIKPPSPPASNARQPRVREVVSPTRRRPRRHARQRAAKLFVAKAAALDSYEVVGALLVAHANAKKAATPRKLEALLQKNGSRSRRRGPWRPSPRPPSGPRPCVPTASAFRLRRRRAARAASSRSRGATSAARSSSRSTSTSSRPSRRPTSCAARAGVLPSAPSTRPRLDGAADSPRPRTGTRVADGRGVVGEVSTLAADPTSLLIVAARRAVGRARGLVAYPQPVSLKVGAWTLATHDGSRPVADVLGSCDGVVVDVLGDEGGPEESGASWRRRRRASRRSRRPEARAADRGGRR